MTQLEFEAKLAAYQTSDAPLDIKQKAIQDLLNYYTQSTDTAIAQYLDSQAELLPGEIS